MTAEAQVTCNSCGVTFDEELLNRASLDAFADLSVDYDVFCPCGSDDLTFHKPAEDKKSWLYDLI